MPNTINFTEDAYEQAIISLFEKWAMNTIMAQNWKQTPVGILQTLQYRECCVRPCWLSMEQKNSSRRRSNPPNTGTIQPTAGYCKRNPNRLAAKRLGRFF